MKKPNALPKISPKRVTIHQPSRRELQFQPLTNPKSITKSVSPKKQEAYIYQPSQNTNQTENEELVCDWGEQVENDSKCKMVDKKQIQEDQQHEAEPVKNAQNQVVMQTSNHQSSAIMLQQNCSSSPSQPNQQIHKVVQQSKCAESIIAVNGSTVNNICAEAILHSTVAPKSFVDKPNIPQQQSTKIATPPLLPSKIAAPKQQYVLDFKNYERPIPKSIAFSIATEQIQKAKSIDRDRLNNLTIDYFPKIPKEIKQCPAKSQQQVQKWREFDDQNGVQIEEIDAQWQNQCESQDKKRVKSQLGVGLAPLLNHQIDEKEFEKIPTKMLINEHREEKCKSSPQPNFAKLGRQEKYELPQLSNSPQRGYRSEFK